MNKELPVNITESQVQGLQAIAAHEGRGLQGLREDEVKGNVDPRVLRNLVQNGLVAERSRWGRTFYFTTKDGRRVIRGA